MSASRHRHSRGRRVCSPVSTAYTPTITYTGKCDSWPFYLVRFVGSKPRLRDLSELALAATNAMDF
jgi:hypothetical protein